MDQSPGTKKLWESENMLGRLAEPHEFAEAAIFLRGDASSFMTGSTVDANHGKNLQYVPNSFGNKLRPDAAEAPYEGLADNIVGRKSHFTTKYLLRT